MKNIIERNKKFNERTFWALNTFLQGNGKVAKASNVCLNLLYKYHKYPISATAVYKLKNGVKNAFKFNIQTRHLKGNSGSISKFIKTKSFSFVNPQAFQLEKTKRCAIFVGFSFDGTIPDYDVYYLKELKKVCDSIVFIMDNPIMSNELDKIKDLVDYAEFRHHGGYDFGSWRRGLIYLREHLLLNKFESLVLANDSCYGPVYSFDKLFQKMETSNADFWGLVDSYDGDYHILSFFYYFTSTVFHDPYFIDFFIHLPRKMNFDEACLKGERSFTVYLKKKFSSAVLLPDFSTATSKSYLSGNRNPTLWPYTLLQQGFPLIKVKAMTGSYGIELEESRADVKYYLYHYNKKMYQIIIDDLTRRRRNDMEDVLPDFDHQSREFELAILNKKVVSFDIFDTLLLRPFISPTDLFSFLENKYNMKGYQEERLLAEKRARALSDSKEVTFDEIYENILPKFQCMKQLELKWEEKLLQVNPQVFELYEQAVKMGKTVIATSDMYLSKDFLKKILSEKGYKNISQVYVSSEYKKTKGTGELYKEVLHDLKLEEKNIIHIGDNCIADVQIPKQLGIVSYHLHKVHDDFLHNPANAKFANYYNKHQDLSSSIHMALVSHRAWFEKKENFSYWNMLGYRFGGPLAVGYLNFITKALLDNHIDKALFVARDGWGLKKLYDKYFYAQTNIESEYVYLQRIIGIKGLLTWCDCPQYLEILLKTAQKDIPEIVISKNYEENKKEYRRFYSELKKWAQQTHDEFYKHVAEKAGDSKSISIIDMTTSKFSSYRFSKEVLKDRLKLGLYTGTFEKSENFHYMTFAPNELLSNNNNELKLSELLLSSIEPLVIDLKDGNPVYAEEYGIRQSVYPEIFAGIEEYVKEYLRLFGFTPEIMNNMETWMDLAKFYFIYSNEVDDDFMKQIYETGLPGIDSSVKSMYDVVKEKK